MSRKISIILLTIVIISIAICSLFFPKFLGSFFMEFLLVAVSASCLLAVFRVKTYLLKLLHLCFAFFLFFLVMSFTAEKVEYLEIPIGQSRESNLLQKTIYLENLVLFSETNPNYVSDLKIDDEMIVVSVNHPVFIGKTQIFQYSFELTPVLTTGIMLKKNPYDFPLTISSILLSLILVVFLVLRRKS